MIRVYSIFSLGEEGSFILSAKRDENKEYKKKKKKKSENTRRRRGMRIQFDSKLIIEVDLNCFEILLSFIGAFLFFFCS